MFQSHIKGISIKWGLHNIVEARLSIIFIPLTLHDQVIMHLESLEMTKEA